MTRANDPKETAYSRRHLLKRTATATGLLVVGAQSTTARQGGHEMATGSVVFSPDAGGETHLSFTAHGDDHPRGPRGRVTVQDYVGVDFRGTVDCYYQPSDHFARFAGEITDIDGGDSTHFRIAVNEDRDFGPDPPNDLVGFQTRKRGRSLPCGEDETLLAFNVVTAGNLRVHQP